MYIVRTCMEPIIENVNVQTQSLINSDVVIMSYSPFSIPGDADGTDLNFITLVYDHLAFVEYLGNIRRALQRSPPEWPPLLFPCTHTLSLSHSVLHQL